MVLAAVSLEQTSKNRNLKIEKWKTPKNREKSASGFFLCFQKEFRAIFFFQWISNKPPSLETFFLFLGCFSFRIVWICILYIEHDGVYILSFDQSMVKMKWDIITVKCLFFYSKSNFILHQHIKKILTRFARVVI